MFLKIINGHILRCKIRVDIQNNLEKIIQKITDKINDKGGYMDLLEELKTKHKSSPSVAQLFMDISELLQLTSMSVKYLMLDLEATRRERDELRCLVEDEEEYLE